ncbi:MAG: Stp1/IreP family PP2C-type Ser/Thr phosphatase [Halanaerobiaceae bacterium]
MIQYSIYTNKGNVRLDNEDSYLVIDTPHPLYMVADGMGGHRAGDIASKMAVNYIEDYQFNYENLPTDINRVINKANKVIYEQGKDKKEYQGMGTTLSMGIIYNNYLYIGHVGDSRIYLFRDGDLKQLTTDHSLVNELIQNNEITSQEAFNHPQKNIITQALGSDEELKVETKKFGLKPGDRLLFCTDGLHDMLRNNEIKDILLSESNTNKVASLLGNTAMDNGGNDNITLIIVDYNVGVKL